MTNFEKLQYRLMIDMINDAIKSYIQFSLKWKSFFGPNDKLSFVIFISYLVKDLRFLLLYVQLYWVFITSFRGVVVITSV